MSVLLKQLEAQLDHAWTVAEMASLASISPTQLRRDCVQVTGLSPMQHLKRLRMEKANDLLRGTDWPVKRVAITVGFRDLSHFVRDFHKWFGLRPSQVRPNC